MNTNDKKAKMQGQTAAAGHLGIDNLVEVSIDGLEIGQDVYEVTRDGIQLTDGLVILTNLPKLQNIAEKARQAVKEIADLTPDEIEEFEQRVSEGANLPATGLAGKVRRVLLYIASVYRHINATMDLVQEGKDVFTGLRSAA